MLLFDGGFLLIGIGLWVFCFIDVLTTPATETRTLPKLAWVFIVLIFADLGSIAWLILGRRWGKVPVPTGAGRPGRSRAAGAAAQSTQLRVISPDDDEEFLASLRARVEEQRRRAREQDEQNGES